MSHDWFGFLFYFYMGGGLCVIASAVAMHEVRARLVRVLLSEKSYLATSVSDWEEGARYYFNAIKKEYIWGAKSTELLNLPSSTNLIKIARAIYIIKSIGFTLFIAAAIPLFALKFFY